MLHCQNSACILFVSIKRVQRDTQRTNDMTDTKQTTSDATLNQPSYAYDGSRYQVRSYKLRGVENFRVDDTFNGGKAVAKGFTRDVDAITRRDELNQFQHAREIEFSVRQFCAAHGHIPRGTGSWGFCDEQHANANDYLEHVFWFNGTYTEARAAARKHFASQPNVSIIVVMS